MAGGGSPLPPGGGVLGHDADNPGRPQGGGGRQGFLGSRARTGPCRVRHNLFEGSQVPLLLVCVLMPDYFRGRPPCELMISERGQLCRRSQVTDHFRGWPPSEMNSDFC